MDNINDIDNIFKESLGDNQEPPPASVWEAVSRELDKREADIYREKYYRLKRWVAAAVLFIIGSAVLFMLMKPTHRGTTELVSTGKPATGRTKKLSVEKVSTADHSAASAIVKADARASIGKQGVDLDNKTLSAPTDASLTGNGKLISSGGGAAKTESTNVHAQPRIENTPVVPGSAVEHKARVKTRRSENGAEDDRTFPRIATGGISRSNNNETRSVGELTPAYNRKHVNESSAMSSELVDGRKNKEIETTQSEEIKSVPSQDRNYYANAGLAWLDNFLPSSTISAPGAVRPVYQLGWNDSLTAAMHTAMVSSKKDLPGRFSLELVATPNHSFTRLTNDRQLAGPGHDKDEAEKAEQQGRSYSLGLLLGYKLNRKWSVQTGAIYSSARTNISGKTIYAKPDNRGHAQFEFNCSSGYAVITPKTGTTPAVGDSLHVMASNSTINSIAIPVIIQYNIQAGRFILKPSAGVAFDLLTSGNSVTRVEGSRDNKQASHLSGLKRNYLEASVGAGIEYRLSKRLSLTATPNARFALTAINEHTPVKTYQNYLGVQTGIRLNL